MQTEDITMTGNWKRVADGPGLVTVSHRGGFEWRIQPAAWVADQSMVGHLCGSTDEKSMSLEAGESLWLRASSRLAAQVTAENPVLA